MPRDVTTIDTDYEDNEDLDFSINYSFMDLHALARNRMVRDSEAIGVFHKQVSIIGCGAVGSWLAVLLAKYGYRLTLIDMDHVDLDNINTQNFPVAAIHAPKTAALSTMINLTTGSPNVLRSHPRRFRWNDHAPRDSRGRIIDGTAMYEQLRRSSVIVCAADSMITRSELAEFLEWTRTHPLAVDPNSSLTCAQPQWVVDTRTGFNYTEIHTHPTTIEGIAAYRRTIVTDDEAVNAPCGLQMNPANAALAASLAAQSIRRALDPSTSSPPSFIGLDTDCFMSLGQFDGSAA